jgi:hypothetical protein
VDKTRRFLYSRRKDRVAREALQQRKIDMTRFFSLALAASASFIAVAALAASPVAVVEDSTGKAPVAFMDNLEEGQSFSIPPDATVTISYYASCLRETIAGGKVTVGKAESKVEDGGKVKRDKVDCDGGKMLLSSDQAAKSGVFAIRGAPAPQFVVFSASPLIELSQPGELTIERVDRGGAEIKVDADDLLNGRYYDLAKAKRALVPGGIYRAASGESTVVFKVDANAKPGAGALVGRLVRL